MDASTSSPARIVSGRSSRFAAMQMDLGNMISMLLPPLPPLWAVRSIARIRREDWPDITLPDKNAPAEEA
ncbi:MAG: hypothetical protein KJN79_12540 [Gammaproteobacteria bacterium]|nr:hypothetical protein [Gammaproteobacteria bacterium]